MGLGQFGHRGLEDSGAIVSADDSAVTEVDHQRHRRLAFGRQLRRGLSQETQAIERAHHHPARAGDVDLLARELHHRQRGQGRRVVGQILTAVGPLLGVRWVVAAAGV